jgi:hypothetical protein
LCRRPPQRRRRPPIPASSKFQLGRRILRPGGFSRQAVDKIIGELGHNVQKQGQITLQFPRDKELLPDMLVALLA